MRIPVAMTNHEFYMDLALQNEQTMKGQTDPNPLVGSVIVNENRIVGSVRIWRQENHTLKVILFVWQVKKPEAELFMLPWSLAYIVEIEIYYTKNLIKEEIKKACFEKILIKTRFFYNQLNQPFIKSLIIFVILAPLKRPIIE